MARPPKLWFRRERKQWFTTINGKQIPLGKDRKAAQLKFHRLMLENPTSQTRKTVLTVAEVLDLWLDHIQNEVESVTWKRYRENAQNAADDIGSTLATDLRPLHLAQWIGQKTWASTTKSLAVTVVKMAYRWACMSGWLEVNPIALARAPGKQVRPPAEPGAVEAVLAKSLPKAVDEVLRFLAATGCRPAEARRLEAYTIDFKSATCIVHGKTGERLVVLPKGILGLLRARCKRYASGPIFRSVRGNPWTMNALYEAIYRASGGTVAPYQIRKWFATKLIARGVDSALVAKLLGHSDTKGLGILTKHYLFPEIETLRRAVEDVSP
jgi:integrase